MGIEDDVLWFFDTIELLQFVEMNPPTYHEPTIEFLATATLIFSTEQDMSLNPNQGNLFFRVGNKGYKISIGDVCRALCLPSYGSPKFPRNKSEIKVWRNIGDPYFTEGKIKAATIRHPALRYAHKVLSNTLFSRYDTGVVNIEEYFLLMKPFMEKSIEVNLGVVLTCLLVDIRHRARSTTMKNYIITIGGIITPILQACGVKLQGYTQIEGDDRIDTTYLSTSRVVNGYVPETSNIIYNIRTPGEEMAHCILPSPNLPSIQHGDPNFFPDTDELVQQEQTNRGSSSSRRELRRSRSHAYTGHPSQQPSTTPWEDHPTHDPHHTTSHQAPTYESLIRENEALKAKTSFHDKAISKLMKIVRRLTPRSFRTGSSSSHQGDMEQMTDEAYIHKFMAEHIEEEEEDQPTVQVSQHTRRTREDASSSHVKHYVRRPRAPKPTEDALEPDQPRGDTDLTQSTESHGHYEDYGGRHSSYF